ncbi:MAG TPA: choice-of-anchor tandem repeat GloVer-containing protein [Tepidisphaeraceae bacterium]|nr:choice-of-anchor tandem repeat GloVer-containing protein [Tepidisphaeraceae bacterium]
MLRCAALAMQALESRLLLSGYTLNAIASFDVTNGQQPVASLVLDGSGDLYGTAQVGGSGGAGTVFEIANGSGTVAAIASFTGTNGSNPEADLLMDSSGNLYGTTDLGGTDGEGVVFEIPKGNKAISPLASFDGTDGQNPQAGLVMDSSGNLYGTTSGGGTHDDGTIFEIVNGSNTITTLASFDGTDGANPYDGVIMDSSGNLYGTAESGGADGLGDVFELPSGTGTISVLGSFDGTNGEGPASGLTIDSSGDLFGTTQFGGSNSNDGTVFEIVNGSNTITTLASFNGADGQQPEGYMTLDSSGDLFGTTEFGGASDDGTVFEIINGADAISSLYSFTGGNDGANPIGGLSLNNSGDVFGTASNGGVFGGGTAFELSTPSTLLAFASPISNTQAGTALATITVDVENQSGQIITTDDSQVTLTIGTGPAGGTYAQTVSADNGVATFTGITLNTAGTYTLTATDGTYAPVTSNSFDVTPGAATQFVFATQPTDITINQTFPSSIVVNAEDSFGNIDTSYDGLVTLGSKVTPTGVIFTPITLNAVNGVATFSSVPDFTTLGGYKLKATDPGITPGKSNKFFVEPPPSDFVFVTSLPDLTAGATFATSVVVNADNSDGSLDTAYDGPITLGGKVVPTGVSFAPITLDAVNGVATFNTIADFTTAGGYKLKATQTGTLPAKSNKFFVSAGAASTLAFTQQPTGGTVGAPLTPAVAVQVEDSFGNPVTTDSSQVTLTVQSGPGTLGGVDSVAASGGVASFADLVLNAPGSYVLTATDGNSAVAVANSAPFDIAS